MVIFSQWISRKQFFQVTVMCDYRRRFIEQFDSQQSFADIKHGNVTAPQNFVHLEYSFLVVQVEIFIN